MATPKAAAAPLSYEYLTSEEEVRMVENVLMNYEREHFQLSQVNPSEHKSPERVATLEAEITRLRALKASFTPADPAV